MATEGKTQTPPEIEEVRSDRRFKIELPVMVNSIMEDQHGWIIDVSRKGLKLWGINAPPRSRVFIHYKGQMAEGTVRWYRADEGIGIVLDEPLQKGTARGRLAPIPGERCGIWKASAARKGHLRPPSLI